MAHPTDNEEELEEQDELQGQMSFLDHLEELRKRLIRILIAVGVAFGVAWIYHGKLTRLIQIPIAAAMDDTAIRRVLNGLPSTPLEAGVHETMERFAALRDAGRLDTSDLEL